MDVSLTYIKRILRHKHKLTVGSAKTSRFAGKYTIVCKSTQGSVVLSDLIARHVGLSYDAYRLAILQGLEENVDYWYSSGEQHIFFKDKPTAVQALMNLYPVLERRIR